MMTSLQRALPDSRSFGRASYSLALTDRLTRYLNVVSVAPPETLEALLAPGLASAKNGDALHDIWARLFAGQEHLDELNGFNYLEIQSTLPDEQLAYGDRMSMAHSLEVRFPYLDQEIVRYVQSLPSGLKMAGFRGKQVHRRICSNFLPPQAIRARKRGFGATIAQRCFLSRRSSRMFHLLSDPSSLMYQYLNRGEVGRALEDHQRGRRNLGRLLFNLVVLEEWLRSRHSSSPRCLESR